MHLIIVLLHVSACFALIVIVLLQKGKGASMGAAFGGSSQTVFGSTGAASFLQKITTGAAIVFMLTCLTLAYQSGKGRKTSIMKGVAPSAPVASEPVESPAPAPTEGQAD
jgi:preprotein translocase subunit SecG